MFHRQGRATGVTVSDVKITQWKGAIDTEKGSDIQQFSVHYTIFWSSFLHHGNGFTEARSVYSVDGDTITCVGNEILKTNGNDA